MKCATVCVLACALATAAAFVPALSPASSTLRTTSRRAAGEEGGNFVSDLFGGAKEAVEKVADNLSSDEHDVPGGDTVINSKNKASRFRVDPDRKEGESAVRAFVEPTPPSGGGGGGGSSSSWNIPSRFDKDFGSSASSIKSRAGDYMNGKLSPSDMAMAMRKSGVSSERALEVIGTMPAGQKRADLFDLFTQF